MTKNLNKRLEKLESEFELCKPKRVIFVGENEPSPAIEDDDNQVIIVRFVTTPELRHIIIRPSAPIS